MEPNGDDLNRAERPSSGLKYTYASACAADTGGERPQTSMLRAASNDLGVGNWDLQGASQETAGSRRGLGTSKSSSASPVVLPIQL